MRGNTIIRVKKNQIKKISIGFFCCPFPSSGNDVNYIPDMRLEFHHDALSARGIHNEVIPGYVMYGILLPVRSFAV